MLIIFHIRICDNASEQGYVELEVSAISGDLRNKKAQVTQAPDTMNAISRPIPIPIPISILL